MQNNMGYRFLSCDASFEESGIVLFGAPFDSTTSFRPGARFGPQAVRNDSFGLEAYSLYQNKSLEDALVYDGGDLELPFGNSGRALEQIQEYAAEVLRHNKIPFMVGGEHLVTLGVVRAVARKYPDIHILHFDAHADLREEYGGEPLSHATVLRRVWDELGDGRIYQYGIRSGEKQEFDFAQNHTILHPFNLQGIEAALEAMAGAPVYVTLDLDVLDTAVFPGTGTPEPGGVGFADLLAALLKLKQLNIVGADVVELAPLYDASGASTAAACKVIRELLILLGGK